MDESRIIYTVRGERTVVKRSRRKRVWLWFILFFLAALIGGTVYIIRLPDWQVRELDISGNKILGTEEIRGKIRAHLAGSFMFFLPKSSAFLVSSEEVEYLLKSEFPRIRAIGIERSFPDSLTISLEERKLWGMYCVAAECVYIDDTGFAFEKAPESVGALIRKVRADEGGVGTGINAVDPVLVRFMEFLREKVEESVGVEVTEYFLIVNLPSEIRVATNEGFKIYFNREDDFENVFRVLRRLFEEEIKDRRSEIEYVDVRFGNKVFYK